MIDDMIHASCYSVLKVCLAANPARPGVFSKVRLVAISTSHLLVVCFFLLATSSMGNSVSELLLAELELANFYNVSAAAIADNGITINDNGTITAFLW